MVACWAVVAHVGPQTSRLGLAPCPAPAPVPACRRHAAYPPPSHAAAALPPADPATHCFLRPSPPESISPVRCRAALRSRIAGRGEDDRHTWKPAHAPADPGPPDRARSAGSARVLARSVRIAGSSASAVHGISPESRPARTPTSPKHLRSACVTFPRNRDRPRVSAHASGFAVAGVPVTDGGPVSLGPWAGKLR